MEQIDQEGTPIRERILTAKKTFTAKLRKNKSSRYITVPQNIVEEFGLLEDDSINLAFLGYYRSTEK